MNLFRSLCMALTMSMCIATSLTAGTKRPAAHPGWYPWTMAGTAVSTLVGARIAQEAFRKNLIPSLELTFADGSHVPGLIGTNLNTTVCLGVMFGMSWYSTRKLIYALEKKGHTGLAACGIVAGALIGNQIVSYIAHKS